MKEKALKNYHLKYRRLEGRAGFYDAALEIVDDHPLQASIIILAVWNTMGFRPNASNSQNLIDLIRGIKKCKNKLKFLEGYNLKNVNFKDNKIENIIKQVYSYLSKIEIVKYTGASKVMHLLNRELFVMWDKGTRKEYGYKDKADENDYFDFLKFMQKKFSHIPWNNSKITLAKAIDEMHQVTITIPNKIYKK